MTISSSLNAGVAGLNANAARLATISDNIANSATYGYRRASTEFHSMVINGSNPGSYTAGGVRVTSTRLIDQGGALVSTSNATDLAVNGRGFLPVTTAAAATSNTGYYPMSLMTTASFRPDSDGVMTTASGMVLMGWPLNSDGSLPAYPRDTSASLQPVRVNMNEFAGEATDRVNIAVNLPATATAAGATPRAENLSVEYFGNLGSSESLAITFTPNGTPNQWVMSVRDSASGNAEIGQYTLTFDDTRGAGGRLTAIDPAPGYTLAPGEGYDPATGLISMSVAGGPMSLGIGRLDTAGGMSQLSDQFAPLSITKNGFPVGNLIGVEVDPSGFVNAIYDNGSTRALYQIPLVDVPNPNGLTSVDNQAYQISGASGGFFLWNAGEGPTGSIRGYARQESATDVASELTQLIQTQRAYSSNAKVIQTVDEMLQETTNIKR